VTATFANRSHTELPQVKNVIPNKVVGTPVYSPNICIRSIKMSAAKEIHTRLIKRLKNYITIKALGG
jgi:hypothetical protein